MVKAGFVVLRQAIDVIFRRLGCLPPSEKGNEVRAWLHDCVQESEQWRASPPTTRELDGLMKRVLALHIEVRKLERLEIVAVANGLGSPG